MRTVQSVVALLVCASTASAQEPASESAEEPASETAVREAGRWELTAAAGVSSMSFAMPGMQLMGNGASARPVMPGTAIESRIEPTALAALRYRVSERVVWAIPTLSFAYLGGTAGQREWIPWAGLTTWAAGYSSIEGSIVDGGLGAGIGVRESVTAATTINVTAAAGSEFRYRSRNGFCEPGEMCEPNWQPPETWIASATAGLSHRIADAVTLNVGVGASQRVLVDGTPADGSKERGTSISFGSIQTVGLRLLPLIEARINRRWSVDGYAAAAYDTSRAQYEQRYLLGMTRVWPSR